MHMGIPSSDLSIDPTSAVKHPTYDDLLAYFAENVAPTCPKGTAANLRSALMTFVAGINKASSDPIGPELREEFEHCASSYFDARKAEGSAKGSLANRKSELKKWKSMYDDFILVSGAQKFSKFHEAFEYYYAIAKEIDNKITVSSIAKRAGLNPKILYSHLRNKPKTVKDEVSSLMLLERAIFAPPGTFTKFSYANGSKNISKRKEVNSGSTAYGKKLSKLLQDQYRLKVFPSQLEHEFLEFVEFKTCMHPFPLERNKKWRKRPISQATGDFLEYCKIGQDQYAVSAQKFATDIASFFGVLKINGYDENEFSLAYLTDLSLIKEYMSYMYNRLQAVTNTSLAIPKIAMSLIIDEYGFLLQQPHFCARRFEPVPETEWNEVCTKAYHTIGKLMKNYKKDGLIKQGRNPFENIKDILDLQHPITALLDLANNMEAYVKAERWHLSHHAVISLERDILLTKILTAQPLRIKMFREMTYFPDNSGNLYQKKNEAWAIRFKPEDFKNEKGAAKKGYDVELPVDLWPVVSGFMEKVRPEFEDDSALVFVPCDTGHERTTEGKTDFLADSFRCRTQQFLPDCPGFGPHSGRHIVATDFIRNNPNGFQVAADVLHDKLETVLKHYAHLRAEDGHKHYLKYLAGVVNEWRKAA